MTYRAYLKRIFPWWQVVISCMINSRCSIHPLGTKFFYVVLVGNLIGTGKLECGKSNAECVITMAQAVSVGFFRRDVYNRFPSGQCVNVDRCVKQKKVGDFYS